MTKNRSVIRTTGVALMLLSFEVFAQVGEARPAPAKVDASVEREPGRLRWGVNGSMGLYIFNFPQVDTLMAGVEGRLGYQAGRTTAVYATFGLVAGMGASEVTTTSVLYGSMGVLGELTLLDHFFLALGPTLAAGSWNGFLYADTRGGAVVGHLLRLRGIAPALDFRLGFGVGGRDAQSGRRHHFTVAIDVLVLFPLGADGHEFAVGSAPALMLGYDAR